MNEVAAAARVCFVTSEPRQPEWEDDQLSVGVLADRGIEVEFVAWDDQGADWDGYGLVVVRSPRDYGERLAEFLAWADSVGPEKLRNGPDLLRWNTDKRYLAELDGAGLPVPPTLLIAPYGPVPDFGGKVVIKPITGAGARDTGIFSDEHRERGLELLEKLGDQNEIAMIQPYIEEIDQMGETAVIFFGGRYAYSLNKRTFIPEASEEEIDLGCQTIAWLSNRFGRMPLYARIDMVTTPGGPVLMEVELTGPGFYLGQTTSLEVPGAVAFADAVEAELA